MTTTTPTTLTPEQARLVDAIDWAAGQDARRRLGLPSEWEQGNWIVTREGVALGGNCGTAGCVAGYVATAQLQGKPYRPEWASRFEWHVTLPDDTTGEVRLVARHGLGLTGAQAEILFEPDNSLEDLIDIGRQILAGELNPIRSRDDQGYSDEEVD